MLSDDLSSIAAISSMMTSRGVLKKDYKVFSREIKNTGYEVKTKDRIVTFQPTFLIDEETFDLVRDDEGNKILLEDFNACVKDFRNWLKTREPELREAFNV